MELFSRSSGILLHPTSLPGPHGIGDIGSAAFHFVDFLSVTGQTWWQMLPVNPPGYGESPYNTLSTMAGNPLLISLETLETDGLLTDGDLGAIQTSSPTRVDFQSVRFYKEKALRKAFAAFQKLGKNDDFKKFCDANEEWLHDFSLFMAIKESQQGKPWIEWPADFRVRKVKALEQAAHDFNEEILYQKFLQYEFAKQWKSLKEYAKGKGIRLLGDVPIFVAHDSADVWRHPTHFKLRSNGYPSVGAGVPPDYFSKTGQLWGNPLYRWSVHRKNNYSWWISRLKNTMERFDALRLDHFIGFYRTWEVPAGEKTAEKGKWTAGPRAAFFKQVSKQLGRVPIVAEDLGNIIPPVLRLRKQFHFPGMFVLHFSFWGGYEAAKKRMDELDHRMVVYTGTHDNNTSRGWLAEVHPPDMERAAALQMVKTDGSEIHWDLIKLALSLNADLAIVPLQDLLGLGTKSRMNQPGTAEGNWAWRFKESEITGGIRDRFLELTKINNRFRNS